MFPFAAGRSAAGRSFSMQSSNIALVLIGLVSLAANGVLSHWAEALARFFGRRSSGRSQGRTAGRQAQPCG
jgi:hypothetical protein